MYNKYGNTCRGMVQVVGKPCRTKAERQRAARRPWSGLGHSVLADRTDPRITRTGRALAQAIVELASQRPVSQITVADLAGRAGVTRATFYHHYSGPLELLVAHGFAGAIKAWLSDDSVTKTDL